MLADAVDRDRPVKRPRVALLTREFPPEVYGGAGVHVEYLAPALAEFADIEVHCFGAPRSSALVGGTYEPWSALSAAGPDGGALGVMSVDLAMAAGVGVGVRGVDLVHSHTWYANLAGHLAALVHGVPHVMTAHSLEPLRPWKAEQLGGGYALSSFCERTAIGAADAVVAVSTAMRHDILAAYPAVDPWRVEVVPNGIDIDAYQPVGGTDGLVRLGVDPGQPSVLFVGRMTRQKGIDLLLAAGAHIDPQAQLVLCAGAPDTAALGDELRAAAAALADRRGRVVWIEAMAARADIVQLMSHATVFVCPSVYEPFGLINVEAMACGTAVVATATGGIVDVVVDGETGYLVALDPAEPWHYVAELAARVNELLADPARAAAFGRAGRRRVVDSFTWGAVAARTAAVYRKVLEGRGD
ncbi:MAG: glycogen synthase [Acidimicrobiales bacterium]